MIKKVICLIAIFLFFSCNDSNDSADCSAVICAPSENTVFIRFLDSESEENLLDNYTILSETIQIMDIESKEVTPIIGETLESSLHLRSPQILMAKNPIQSVLMVVILSQLNFLVNIEAVDVAVYIP